MLHKNQDVKEQFKMANDQKVEIMKLGRQKDNGPASAGRFTGLASNPQY